MLSSEIQTVQIQDFDFVPFISETEIHKRISEMAAEISKACEGEEILCLVMLKGAFVFAADLIRALDIPAEVSFIRYGSYIGEHSSGELQRYMPVEPGLMKNRHVLLIEDIVDTGLTLSKVLPELEEEQPKSLRVATLLHKPEVTEYDLDLDFIGFEIENKFVVGYGLDFDNKGRDLKAVYQMAGGE